MDLAKRYKFQFAVFTELLQVWFMLEEVGVQFLVIETQVGFYVIREFNDLEIDTFLGQGILDMIQDFRMRHGCSTDLEDDLLVAARCFFCFLLPAAAGCKACQGSNSQYSCNQFLHKTTLLCDNVYWITVRPGSTPSSCRYRKPGQPRFQAFQFFAMRAAASFLISSGSRLMRAIPCSMATFATAAATSGTMRRSKAPATT